MHEHDNGVCPSCGHCKHCGRGGHQLMPTWPQPTWIGPWWGVTPPPYYPPYYSGDVWTVPITTSIGTAGH